MRTFNWVKKGLIFKADIADFTHGSLPCVLQVKDYLYIVAFTCRDSRQRSHIFLSHATISERDFKLIGEPKLALTPGPLGHFDCDGTISACFVRGGEKSYLYYVGWQNLAGNIFHNDTGRAILDEENLTLTKEFAGPVLGMDKNNPLFAAGTAFLVEGNIWKTWYNSGIKWETLANNKIKPCYGIHYATSKDGIDWKCEPGLVIPFKDEYEYAFGRPCVLKIDSLYYMWFAHRATKDAETYRMGFAVSEDGVKWKRYDELAGIDVSESGWDSEMICYPHVFEHKGLFYMLYNGNNYGKTGFGYAMSPSS
jgi:hypothetical protein